MKTSTLLLSLLFFVAGVLAGTHPIPVSPSGHANGITYEAERAFKNVKETITTCKLDERIKISGTVVLLSSSSYIIFTVNIPSDGVYPVSLFAQACEFQKAIVVDIYGNGLPLLEQSTLDLEAGVITHDLPLRFGLNTISYKIIGAGSVAIDAITVKGGSAMAVRGATVTYEEIEAEVATYMGTLIGPGREYCTLPSEASGRKAVQLIAAGNYVEFSPSQSFNAIVVRYSIPNSADGIGQSADLNLLINGAQVTVLNVTSFYSWTYGTYPFYRDPGAGNPHHFYDDVRYSFGNTTYPAGTKVRLVGAASITYTIDLADFYTIPAPYARPANYFSVLDKGADPTGLKDSAPAFQEAIQAALSANQGVWIPEGKYSLSYRINIDNTVTIRGAGPWYSELHGLNVGFDGQGCKNAQFFDFAVFGQTNVRVDSTVSSGIGNTLSSSLVQNLWIEHDKCGMWLNGPFDSLLITGVTIRNTFADGINFHMGVTNSVVEQTVIRNTGDDCLAMWPQLPSTYTGNVFKFNTLTIPVLANTIAIYGGSDNAATDNYCADTVVEGAGLQTGTRFSSVQLSGSTQFARNTLVRTGSPDMYNPASRGEGSIWLYSDSGPITTGSVTFEEITISDAYYQMVMFYQGPVSNINFTNIQANNASFMWEERVGGSIYAQGVVATAISEAGIWSCGANMTITQGPGNSGWDNTICN